MFETIVVGTDGSPTAAEAVHQAARLARACGEGTTVHVVTAYKPLEAMFVTPEAIPVGVSVGVDPRADAHTVAEDTGGDLIVVGSRGMTGAARFLLGSVPNKVSHHAPCDVLIVSTA